MQAPRDFHVSVLWLHALHYNVFFFFSAANFLRKEIEQKHDFRSKIYSVIWQKVQSRKYQDSTTPITFKLNSHNLQTAKVLKTHGICMQRIPRCFKHSLTSNPSHFIVAATVLNALSVCFKRNFEKQTTKDSSYTDRSNTSAVPN